MLIFTMGGPAQGRDDDYSEMLTNIQYRILKRISPGAPDSCSGCFLRRQVEARDSNGG